MEDKELVAMTEISRALSKFDESDGAALDRVLQWVNSRFGRAQAAVVPRAASVAVGLAEASTPPQFDTAAELLAAVSPQMEFEKAVAIGYWIQVVNGQPEFGSQEVNATLKNIGYPVKNITDAFSTAMNRRPALVLQTQKSGSSRQARKQYKLTSSGVQWVRSRLAGEGVSADAVSNP